MMDKLLYKIGDYVDWAMEAHQQYPKKPSDSIRYWDKKTPYLIHPVWCGMTILTETRLADEIRIPGAAALLLHDVLEDTTKGLPEDLPGRVIELVEGMTFYGGIEEEMLKVWDRGDEIILLKLYDKTSTLLDCVWMKTEERKIFGDYSSKLLERAKKIYGELNITKLARSVI